MVSQPERQGNRFVALIASLALAALIAGGCASAVTSGSNIAASVVGAQPTGVTTVPANLPSATSATSTTAPAVPASGGAVALQDQFVAVIKQVTPSVVEIETSAGLGSGVIYDTKGDIVTNAHVVGTSKTFNVTLSDGRSVPGTLVGTFTPDDIAVIHITATGLTAATFGDSSSLSVGDFVLAMGNPLGLQSSAPGQRAQRLRLAGHYPDQRIDQSRQQRRGPGGPSGIRRRHPDVGGNRRPGRRCRSRYRLRDLQ
jgi:S1-C subfamily serine protease